MKYIIILASIMLVGCEGSGGGITADDFTPEEELSLIHI